MLVLFDLDGTLTDSREGVILCIQHALAASDQPVPAFDDLTECVGPPLAASFSKLLGTADLDRIDRAIAAYRRRFEDVGMFENRVFPGILDVLEEFAASTKLCVVTIKPAPYATRIIDHFGIARFISAVYGPDLNARHYTKKELIREACRDAPKRPAVMVGDRAEDVLAAHAVGTRSIAVLWGYGSRGELLSARPDCLVGSASELSARLRAIASVTTDWTPKD